MQHGWIRSLSTLQMHHHLSIDAVRTCLDTKYEGDECNPGTFRSIHVLLDGDRTGAASHPASQAIIRKRPFLALSGVHQLL